MSLGVSALDVCILSQCLCEWRGGGAREIAIITFYSQNMSLSAFTALQLRSGLGSERYRGTNQGAVCSPSPLTKS